MPLSLTRQAMTALAALSLSACASWQQPLTLDVCGPVKLALKYNADGHQDTAYLVARLAGWSAADAAELAFYTQAPDDFEVAFSAPSGTARLFLLQFERAHLLSSVLHSLHGGGEAAVARRQQGLADLIPDYASLYADPHRTGERWQAGFLVHALGDSYSHVWGINQGQAGSVAYNPVVGHIPDGWVHGNPDDIVRNFNNYARYARALFDALDRGQGDRAALDTYLSGVQAAISQEQAGAGAATTDFIRATSTHDYRSAAAGRLDCSAWAATLDYHRDVRPFLESVEARID